MGSSSDQETSPRRSSLTAMDSGAGTASGSRLSCSTSSALNGGVHRGASYPPVFRAREAFEERPRSRSRPPDNAPWAGVPPDILGLVLRLMLCNAEDRASVKALCRHWRRTVGHLDLPPPLPVLVLPELRLSCLNADGALTAARRVAADGVRCVGSSEGWLVAVRPSRQVKDADGECLLVNTFSNGAVVHLLPLSGPNHSSIDPSTSFMTINESCGFFHRANDRKYRMVLRNAVLSASPNSKSKCIVAAFSFYRSTSGLALWQPGMASWYVCRGACIAGGNDLAFYQGKLYMLWRFAPRLFAFDLRENEHGVSVSRVEPCVIDPLLYYNHCGMLRCNILAWRGKLLLIIRYMNGYRTTRRKIRRVGVFALDVSTNPCGITEIYSFDGDCVLVDACGCKFFSAGLHVGVQGDLIYFADEYDTCNGENHFCDTFVYNMNDGMMRPFIVEPSPVNSGAPEGSLNVPVWLCPSE